MRRTPFGILACGLVLSGSLFAQTSSSEAFLLPISLARQVPGAFGSLWETQLCVTAVNGDVHFLVPRLLPPTVVPVNTTRCGGGSAGAAPGWPSGEWIYAIDGTSPNAVINLRIRDVSRDALSFGTELPVVRAEDFHDGTLYLTNVPLDPRFRAALRIYGPCCSNFTIRIVGSAGDVLAEGSGVTQGSSDALGYAYLADSLEITSLAAAFPQLPQSGRVLISITAAEAAIKFWAFVSVTNNDTQQVTTITPQ